MNANCGNLGKHKTTSTLGITGHHTPQFSTSHKIKMNSSSPNTNKMQTHLWILEDQMRGWGHSGKNKQEQGVYIYTYIYVNEFKIFFSAMSCL